MIRYFVSHLANTNSNVQNYQKCKPENFTSNYGEN